MRSFLIALLSVLQLTLHAQTETTIHAPDRRSSILLISAPHAESTEWKYFMVNGSDTTLLTTALTYDEYPPAIFWSKSSEQIIFEEQNREGEDSQIKIYDLHEKAISFETPGLISGKGENNFDRERGLLFYLHKVDTGNAKFDFMSLDITSKGIKTLLSVATSGDPLTGIPDVASIDKAKRASVLRYETSDWKTESKKVNY